MVSPSPTNDDEQQRRRPLDEASPNHLGPKKKKPRRHKEAASEESSLEEGSGSSMVSYSSDDNHKRKNGSEEQYGDESEVSATVSEDKRRKPHSRGHHPLVITKPELALRDRLTTEEGQLAANPQFTVDQARAAAKREYNRRNAARARLRSKHLLSELQEKCSQLTTRLDDLAKENETLKAEVQKLREEKGSTKEELVTPSAKPSSSSSVDSSYSMNQKIQQQQQQQQQHQAILQQTPLSLGLLQQERQLNALMTGTAGVPGAAGLLSCGYLPQQQQQQHLQSQATLDQNLLLQLLVRERAGETTTANANLLGALQSLSSSAQQHGDEARYIQALLAMQGRPANHG